jgi:hypothetical protein
VRRPIEVVVLNCWVTETNETPVGVEQFDQLGKVGQRPREAIDLIDDNHVDLSGPDIFQEPLQIWSVGRTSGISAIVIA